MGGDLRSVQFIGADGAKRFLSRGQISGCSFVLGDPGLATRAYICEGIATGATIHTATGLPTVCAFNASNLKTVTELLRDRHPAIQIVICADDDAWNKDGTRRPPEKNIGIVKALEAAEAIGTISVHPAFPEPRPGLSDYNDLQVTQSAEFVGEQISASVARELIRLRAATLDDDRYEEERRTLAKELGARITYLDDYREQNRDPSGADGQFDEGTIVDKLVTIGKTAELFHTPDKRPFAKLRTGDHTEVHSLRSGGFQGWLRHRYYEQTGGGVAEATLKTAVETLAAVAVYEGACDRVHLRTASFNEMIYIDLCDSEWRVVEITPNGWRITNNPPVRFTRKPGMLPLPEPTPNGQLEPYLDLFNIDASKRVLLVGFIVTSLHPNGPYFILDFFGSEGSAKSSSTRNIRSLIDPSEAPVASFPSNEENLAISASSQHVLTFENVSSLSGAQSDALCRLATGGAVRKRSLYTDEDETILKYRRPAILNGIPNVIARGDLASRAISIELGVIESGDRRDEADLDAALAQALPGAFGAILDGMVAALVQMPDVRREFKGKLPRMADAAIFATAAEEAFGFERGEFLRTLATMNQEMTEDLADNDAVVQGVLSILSDCTEWEGIASALLEELERHNESGLKLPKDATRLGHHLRRIERVLRIMGVCVSYKKSDKRRLVVLKRKHTQPASRSVPPPRQSLTPTDTGTLRDANSGGPERLILI